MGQPKTKTVGGGSATPVGNSWNQFLQGQLWQQPGAQAIPQTIAGQSRPAYSNDQAGFQDFVKSQGWKIGDPKALDYAKRQFDMYQSQGSAPGQFQNVLNQFMNPDIAQMIANNPFLAGQQNWNPNAQLPDAPGWQQNPDAMGTGDFMQQFGVNIGNSGDLLKSFGINVSDFVGPNAGGTPGTMSFQKGSLADYSKDPSFQAVQDIAKRREMQDIADLRARFGMSGNTNSSGSSLAESQYRAEANPRLIASLGDLGRQVQGLDLQQQQINMEGQARANSLNAGAAAGMAGSRDANFRSLLDYIASTRGQDIGVGGTNLNAATNIYGMNQNANQALNTFNQNMFGQQSTNALNNQGQANNWMANLGNMGINMQQIAQAMQQFGLGNLFNSFQQSNAIGTPQAQTVQTPSDLSQIMGLVGGISQFIPGIRGMFGQGGPQSTPSIAYNPVSMPNYMQQALPFQSGGWMQPKMVNP
jgi:hypothetical protein